MPSSLPDILLQILGGLVAVLGGAAVIGTLLPLWRKEAWWIRIFDFPRLQIVGLAVLTLLGGLLLHFWDEGGWPGHAWMVLVALCAVYQFYRIAPYTPLMRKQVLDSTRPKTDRRRHLSMVVTNVLMYNRESGRCLKVIEDCNPDLILAVETDQWWLDELKGLEKTHPYTAYAPLPNTYGLLFFSRLPLRDPQIRFLLDDDVPSFHGYVQLPEGGPEVRVHCLHPKPPAPAESKTTTRRDAELLLVGREIQSHDGPTIVAGDMNDVAWSHTSELFRRLTRLLDPRIGRGLLPTFHADYPWLGWPLDHVFHSAHFKVAAIERLPHIGSDHFPIYLQLSYEPHDKAEQEAQAEEPDESDHEEAAEKIRMGFEEEDEEEEDEAEAARKGEPRTLPST
ncbi:endonuclease/exonuclease/phosphatase family protein [Hymenobacter sp. BT175]|uniref:endonuclease/exonuclease/phosphatase family protein n=1 Tax=Hymenobacter translucens TaxID=2886507 RepID=UPI001D0EA41D|nr:endonuclease/exonuclease/phosphatase family protein [Hymenobacter translucens]MCC2548102.1 endonuclease/exonuclease/phosphatase family protein [Hymenobacter translucens]